MKELEVMKKALEWHAKQLAFLIEEGEVDTLEGLPSYEHWSVADIVNEYKATSAYEAEFGN